MIAVKIELWPFGAEAKAREIGRLYIANTGGTARRGNYRAAVCRRGSSGVPAEIYPASHQEGKPKAVRGSEVRDYPRLAYNVWRLVLRALGGCFPEERGLGAPPEAAEAMAEELAALRSFRRRVLRAAESSGGVPDWLAREDAGLMEAASESPHDWGAQGGIA